MAPRAALGHPRGLPIGFSQLLSIWRGRCKQSVVAYLWVLCINGGLTNSREETSRGGVLHVQCGVLNTPYGVALVLIVGLFLSSLVGIHLSIGGSGPDMERSVLVGGLTSCCVTCRLHLYTCPTAHLST